ncbi:MAG: YadA-like family protein [Sulfurovaceae bacterium]
MKKFTKFSLATVTVLGLSSGAYAVTNVDVGVGGGFTTANAADTLTVTATGGTFISDNVYMTDGAQIVSPDDLIINIDAGPGGYGGYGNLIIQKADTTLMNINETSDGGTEIYTTTTMYDDLDMTDNQIHGLAPGTLGTDAVNLNQLNGIENDMSKGIAAATALANIPQVDQGKTYSLGIGYGHFNGENALAIGGSWRYNTDGIMKVSVGTGGSGATVGVGTAMSW